MKKLSLVVLFVAVLTNSVFAANGDLIVNGNLGVGTSSPVAKIQSTGEIIVGNSGLTCSTTIAGALRYNSTDKVMEFCNGTDWLAFGASSSTPPDAYTKLLLHMDAATSFNDTSIAPHTATVNGAAVSTSLNKFGGGSGYFNGSSYLSFADSEDWNFGSGDFTIDFWVSRAGGFGTTQYLFGQNDAAGNGYYAIMGYFDSANKLQIYYRANLTSYSNLFSTTAISVPGTWTHAAIERYGNVFNLYVNGVLESTHTDTITLYNSANNFSIGRIGDFPSALFNGYIDEFRISKGVARWTTPTFPLPTAPY